LQKKTFLKIALEKETEKPPTGHKLNDNTENEIKQNPALHFSFLKRKAYWRFALWAFLIYGVIFSFWPLESTGNISSKQRKGSNYFLCLPLWE